MRSRRTPMLILLLSQLPACGGQMVGWIDREDTKAPTIASTIPLDEATDVALNTPITATFSERMDPQTVTSASFSLGDGTAPISATVDYSGTTAIFTPESPLRADQEYTATITVDVTDRAGNAMTEAYAWTFTTGETTDTTAPEVISTFPEDDASDVSLGATIVGTFDEAMDLATLTDATFTIADGATEIDGTVTTTRTSVIFNPTDDLEADTEYTATITTAATDLAGNALAADYVWTFTSGALVDVDDSEPRVISTDPQDQESGVAADTLVDATFNTGMDPLTIDETTFLLTGPGTTPVLGTVTYDAIGMTSTFEPAVDLLSNTTYTATVTTGATDLAGVALADDYVWNFTVEGLADAMPPFVVFTNPEDGAGGVPVDATVEATFSEDMDPLSLDDTTFLVTGPGNAPVLGTLEYDVQSATIVFTPDSPLAQDASYTATVTTDATDLAGNGLTEDYVWTFSLWRTVDLGSLDTFVAVAGAGLTNSNSSGVTVLNGNVGLSPTATCMGDGSPCTLLNPVINGTLFANDPEGVAARAKTDLTAAYVDAMARPPGTTVNDLSGMTLVPGVYTSGSTMSIAVGGTVVLDGRGDPNSVFIFQIGSSLTVNNNAQVLLINGANADNVFWAAFASSTIGSNVTFQGNVLAGASNSVGTDSVVVGRLLCTTGQITLLSNAITLP